MDASTSTSAYANNNDSHDIFVNHRGPDVKKTFASHLYRRLITYGLRVFLDYEELQGGEKLTPQIEKAIETASVHVAIFSPGYAQSSWCLNELLHMLKSRAPIVPVFYGVEPADLRWTRAQDTGVYARALCNLEKKRTYDDQPRYNSTIIKEWRNALSSVADISGLELKAFNEDEGVLLDKVIECVLKNTKKTPLNVAKYPTGLAEKARDFEETVLCRKQHSGGAQVVGIAGMGGVGKTTLAKELFNRKSSNYTNSCFLLDAREDARKSGLLSLQRELLKGLFPSYLPIANTAEGIQRLRERLLSSSVLIVLDDIDHVDQVDSLLPMDALQPRSLILITSRHRDVLRMSGVQESSIYQLTGLDKYHSRKLFCSHAFRQPQPPSEFESFVDQFLRACNGLPLSLKVFGCLVYGNDSRPYWELQLKKLEQTLHKDIQTRLQISYDPLDEDEKQVFLDIACFFIGEDKDTAIKIWDGSDWSGSLGLQTLQEKCLVEVDIENKIRMHDLLRDLGRDLAKHSSWPRRVWRGKKDIDDLKQHSSGQGIANVRGIRWKNQFFMSSEEEVSSEEEDRNQRRELELYFPLYWAEAEALNTAVQRMHPTEVAKIIEDDAESIIEDDAESIAKIIEDDAEIIEDDAEIKEDDGDEDDDADSLYPSTNSLQLTEVEEVKVTNLQLLDVDNLSENFMCCVDSPNLVWLRWCACDLSSLPPWIPVVNLRALEVHGKQLKTLWDDKSKVPLQLRELRILAPLSKIPNSISKLTYLERIEFRNPYFKELPKSFGRLRSLKALVLTNCPNLRSLPDSFGNLTNLEHLYMFACTALERLPNSFRDLSRLRTIYFRDCHELEELSGFQNFRSLEKLHVSGSFRLKSIRGLAELTKLRTVHVNDCYDLEELQGFENLGPLEELHVCGCQKLKSIRGSAELTKLRTVNVSSCLELEELQGFENLGSLEELHVFGCQKLKSIRGSVELTKLRTVNVSNCLELEELQSFENLGSLEGLRVFGCQKLKSIRGSAELTKLRTVNVSDCFELEELQGFENLGSLEELHVCGCQKLKSIRGSAELTKLRTVIVSDCFELEELQGFENLGSLEVFHVSGCQIPDIV